MAECQTGNVQLGEDIQRETAARFSKTADTRDELVQTTLMLRVSPLHLCFCLSAFTRLCDSHGVIRLRWECRTCYRDHRSNTSVLPTTFSYTRTLKRHSNLVNHVLCSIKRRKDATMFATSHPQKDHGSAGGSIMSISLMMSKNFRRSTLTTASN